MSWYTPTTKCPTSWGLEHDGPDLDMAFLLISFICMACVLPIRWGYTLSPFFWWFVSKLPRRDGLSHVGMDFIYFQGTCCLLLQCSVCFVEVTVSDVRCLCLLQGIFVGFIYQLNGVKRWRFYRPKQIHPTPYMPQILHPKLATPMFFMSSVSHWSTRKDTWIKQEESSQSIKPCIRHLNKGNQNDAGLFS